jgi:hypothetical protein
VEQVTETAALKDLDFNAGKKRRLLKRGLLLGVFKGANKLPILLIYAAIQ